MEVGHTMKIRKAISLSATAISRLVLITQCNKLNQQTNASDSIKFVESATVGTNLHTHTRTHPNPLDKSRIIRASRAKVRRSETRRAPIKFYYWILSCSRLIAFLNRTTHTTPRALRPALTTRPTCYYGTIRKSRLPCYLFD